MERENLGRFAATKGREKAHFAIQLYLEAEPHILFHFTKIGFSLSPFCAFRFPPNSDCAHLYHWGEIATVCSTDIDMSRQQNNSM